MRSQVYIFLFFVLVSLSVSADRWYFCLTLISVTSCMRRQLSTPTDFLFLSCVLVSAYTHAFITTFLFPYLIVGAYTYSFSLRSC